MSGEQLEQGELARRQPDRPAGSGHAQRSWIQLEIADRDRDRTIWPDPAPESSNPGAQLGHGKGLGQVVVGTAIQARHSILHAIPSAQDEDRRRESGGPQAGTHAEPVKSGQDDIENREIVGVGLRPGQGLEPVTNDVDRMTIGGQRDPNPIGDRALVLDDQDSQVRPPRLGQVSRPTVRS
jgi:hypothetical protein